MLRPSPSMRTRTGQTLKEAGLELGLVDEETFDRVVKPEKMIGS